LIILDIQRLAFFYEADLYFLLKLNNSFLAYARRKEMKLQTALFYRAQPVASYSAVPCNM